MRLDDFRYNPSTKHINSLQITEYLFAAIEPEWNPYTHKYDNTIYQWRFGFYSPNNNNDGERADTAFALSITGCMGVYS